VKSGENTPVVTFKGEFPREPPSIDDFHDSGKKRNVKTEEETPGFWTQQMMT